LGHEAVPLKDALPSAATDEQVFEYAQKNQLKLITCNRDHYLGLAKTAIGGPGGFWGLIILVRRRSRQAECANLLRLLRQAGDSGLSGNINFA